MAEVSNYWTHALIGIIFYSLVSCLLVVEQAKRVNKS